MKNIFDGPKPRLVIYIVYSIRFDWRFLSIRSLWYLQCTMYITRLDAPLLTRYAWILAWNNNILLVLKFFKKPVSETKHDKNASSWVKWGVNVDFELQMKWNKELLKMNNYSKLRILHMVKVRTHKNKAYKTDQWPFPLPPKTK